MSDTPTNPTSNNEGTGDSAPPPPPPASPYGTSSTQPPPPPGPSGMPGAAPAQQNMKAIIGLVLGGIGIVMALCCSILGILLGGGGAALGYLAQQDIAKGLAPQSSKGMAKAALIVGIVALVASALSLIIGLAMGMSNGFRTSL